MLLFCLGTALTQPVNPRPHDMWFDSYTRILERIPGGNNYTPVGGPAYLYALLHQVAVLFGGDLESEFYLASVAHHVLLFLAGLCLYLSHRCLGLSGFGVLTSALLVVFLESSLLPQTAMSENLTLFLLAATLLIGVYLLANPGLSGPRFVGLTLLLALLLGAFVITRVIPVLILPATVLLLWGVLRRVRVVRFAAVSASVVLVLVVAAMAMNVYRYGRFELSDSAGRHLWNAVTWNADEMLADSREYRLLQQAVPDIQGRFWWEMVDPAGIAALESYSRDSLLTKLAVDAVAAHPVTHLEHSVQRSWRTMTEAPLRDSLDQADYYNPLHRTALLPPLVRSWPALDRALAAFHRLVSLVYKPLVVGTLLFGLLAFAGITALGGRTQREARICRVWMFSTGLFLACLGASCLIESGHPRYNVPYLPLLALSGSTAAALLWSLAGKLYLALGPAGELRVR